MIRLVELKILDARLKDPRYFPRYGTADSGGIDLVACVDDKIEIPPLGVSLVPTGIAVNMMSVVEACAAMILPRSGNGHKRGMILGNGTGLIDQDYHGQLFVSVWNRNPNTYLTIEPFEKIAQFVVVPIIQAHFNIVEEFSDNTARGTGGFGSTGK